MTIQDLDGVRFDEIVVNDGTNYYLIYRAIFNLIIFTQ